MTKEELINKKISAISLGCDKNKVDLEHMLFALKNYGFNLTGDIGDAEILIVNTCAFIQPAINEAIDNINLAIQQKNLAKVEKIIVSGCFPQRNIEDLNKSFPQVDCFLPLKENEKIVNIIEDLYGVELSKNNLDFTERVITHGGKYAYLKIADGCSNGCAYCVIPRIRGRFRSVPMNQLIKEAKVLAKQGFKELILVAQDTGRYGDDLYGEPKLIELMKNLSKIKGIEWIKLQYLYPNWVTDELLQFISAEKKVCKYIDMPLQHIDDEILFSMNRKIGEEETRNLINKIKTEYPEIVIRSTFIVGFPGETKQKFQKLSEFIAEGKIDYAVFFPYYKEFNTKAYYMKNHIFNFVKNRRLKKISEIQNVVMNMNNRKKIGTIEEVLIDEFLPEEKIFKGHCKKCSPNIDLCVIIDETLDGILKNIDFEGKPYENLDEKNEFVSQNKVFENSISKANQIQVGEIYKVKLTQMTNLGFKGEIL